MDSSSTERNSVKVRWRVWRVRWGEESPKREVAIEPRRVGVPDDVSKTPQRERRECRLSKAEVKGDGGSSWSWESSRFAQSITIRILGYYQFRFVRSKGKSKQTHPSTSPSTFAKNLVSSIAKVFRLSLKSSNSLTIIGAEVILVDRTLSPRSHTATPVACRSPIC